MKDIKTVIKDLKQERSLLETKRNKLESFLQENNDKNEIYPTQLELLQEQLCILNIYINTLSKRIKDLLGD